MPGKPKRRRRGFLSAGAWIITALAVVSSVIILCRPDRRLAGLVFWTAAREHFVMYVPSAAQWNTEHSLQVHPFLLSSDALQHRMMSGFLSNVPVADLIEVERSLIGPVFAGPLRDVGFMDLTQRLETETLNGVPLIDAINRPSFSPWTSRGHIFGIPHDVHPVMLAYRADLTDAAGIDMSKIKTWDDFAVMMRPLLKHLGPDGKPDHYPLNLWYTSIDQIEVLILQAGGGYFDIHGHVIIDSDSNAHVVSTIVSWMAGPNRIAADAPEFTDSGNELRLDGFVCCAIMPDWLAGVYKGDIPGLTGELKIMPLPAWTPGGRRTSVWGGSMLGIPKSGHHIEAAWTFAKHLYLSNDLAHQLYETNCIISPVKAFWDSPFYKIPDPYFRGQAIGELYISQAPNVPLRSSSPFNTFAKMRVCDAVISLYRYAEATQTYSAAALEPKAHEYLNAAQVEVQQTMNRDVFASSTEEQ
ncbi:MAG TPA: extracellular solute-binding protein [Tepidisphaeraceae bacterium]|nr:extracellular solute-binding protein [Tepidisphaeraceae bacterium]